MGSWWNQHAYILLLFAIHRYVVAAERLYVETEKQVVEPIPLPGAVQTQGVQGSMFFTHQSTF